MISKQIESLFRQEYGDGMKQAEMAIKYHSDQQTISRLLSGQRKFGGLTLDTVDRMFPRAIIYFNGDKVEINNNSGTVAGIVHGNMTTVSGQSESGIPADVFTLIMNSNMTATEKGECIRAILKK